MFLGFSGLIVGAVFLYWSAQRFVTTSVKLAYYYKLSPLFVGIIVMGFATSAPELMTSVIAALEHVPAIVIGNAYGSNIANVGLCIGLTAMLRPIKVSRNIVKQEFPFLLLISFGTLALLIDNKISHLDGVVLLLIFVIYFSLRIYFMKKQKARLENESVEKYSMSDSLLKILIWLLISFVILLISAQTLIFGSEKIALSLHINELVIGLTVVAIGTSLPECAATITPVVLPSAILYRDALLMVLLTLIFFVFSYKRNSDGEITRLKDAVFLVIYISYIIYMVFSL
jgi:cation:H+ antiporter